MCCFKTRIIDFLSKKVKIESDQSIIKLFSCLILLIISFLVIFINQNQSNEERNFEKQNQSGSSYINKELLQTIIQRDFWFQDDLILNSSPTSFESSRKEFTNFQVAEADNIIITASYDDETFFEDVTLFVKPITDSDKIKNSINSILTGSNQHITFAHTYDISFLNNIGIEVEPSKNVKVTMKFKEMIEKSTIQDGWKLYHIKENDNVIDDLTNDTATIIQQTDNQSMAGVEFETDSFSPYTIVGTSFENFSDYITSGSYGGVPIERVSESERVLTSEFQFTYDIPKTQLDNTSDYAIELPDNIVWTNIQENKEYIGRDGLRNAYTYRFIKENNKYYIAIHFLDEYVASSNEKVTGTLTYSASIGQSYRTEVGNYIIPFSDKVSITIPSEAIEEIEVQTPENYDIQSSKTGNIIYDGDTAYLDYTVLIWSNAGTKDVLHVEDTLQSSGLVVDGLQELSVMKADFQYYGGSENDQTNLEKISVQPIVNGMNFELNIPKLNSKQKYIITYRYKVSNMEAGKYINAKNSVLIETPSVPPNSSEKTLELFRNKISKSGQFDALSNKIRWVITVNQNHNDIADAEVTDNMFDKSDDVQITPSEGVTKTSTGYRFTALDNGKNTNTYTITYTTLADESPSDWGETTTSFTNTAFLIDQGEESSSSATVSGDFGNPGGLDKIFTKMEPTSESNIKNVSWQSTIQLPGSKIIPSGTEFQDELKGANNTNNGEHYFTKKQLDEIHSQLVNTFGKDNFQFSIWENSNLTWKYSDYNQVSTDKTYRKFKFRLLRDYQASDITLEYQSTINKADGTYFTNTISSNNFSKEASYKYEETGKIFKMDGEKPVWNGQGNEFPLTDTSHTIEAGGNVSWAVKVILDDNTTSATIRDDVPAGLQLVGFKYGNVNTNFASNQYLIKENQIIWTNSWWSPFPDISFTGTILNDGNILLQFNSLNGKTLKQALGNQDNIYLHLTFKSSDLSLDDPLVKTYSNRVTGSFDGVPIGESEHNQTITINSSRKISKYGHWENENREVHYSLDINPFSEDLAAGGSSYTLTDILEYQEDLTTKLSYDLKQESVVLYDENNQAIDRKNWSWTVEKVRNENGLIESILKLKVPNQQKLRLEYCYNVSKEVATNDKTTLSVRNSATINGFKSGKTDNNITYTWQKMATSGTAQTTKYLKLTKVDMNNFGIVLPNALFEVREHDTDRLVASYETDNNGTLYVTRNSTEALNGSEALMNDTLYYIVEVKAPSGYRLPENSASNRYYFYFSNTDELPSFKENLNVPSTEWINLSKQSIQLYVGNELLPPTTSITIDKKWQKPDGTLENRQYGMIQVTLNQISSDNQSVKAIETRTVSYSDGWTTTFEDLPTRGDEGESYSYFVEEVEMNGYETNYSNSHLNSHNPQDVAISNGTITIINTAKKVFKIPKTGGKGVVTFVASGVVLLCFGILLIYYRMKDK
ncbi:Cna B-type domain-containing protein [Streptococcus suis]|nr:Cna B-type domain-containing protein [Streptococcus suis]